MKKTHKPATSTFGTRLRKVRNARKITQERLAAIIGVSKSQISYYETDKNRPDFDKLVLLSKTLKQSCDFLLTGQTEDERR